MHTVIGLASFAGAIIAPVLYVGQIKTTEAVHEQRIGSLESKTTTLDNAVTSLRVDGAATRAYLEALLPRQGINPQAVWPVATTTALIK